MWVTLDDTPHEILGPRASQIGAAVGSAKRLTTRSTLHRPTTAQAATDTERLRLRAESREARARRSERPGEESSGLGSRVFFLACGVECPNHERCLMSLYFTSSHTYVNSRSHPACRCATRPTTYEPTAGQREKAFLSQTSHTRAPHAHACASLRSLSHASSLPTCMSVR